MSKQTFSLWGTHKQILDSHSYVYVDFNVNLIHKDITLLIYFHNKGENHKNNAYTYL